MKPNIANAVIRGEIHAPTDVSFLTQDMLEVELADGVIIDVGWYPEHSHLGFAKRAHPQRRSGEPGASATGGRRAGMIKEED